MFLPIGDTPNPTDFKPYVNWSLIGINVAVFVLISVPLMGQDVAAYVPGYLEFVETFGSPPQSAYDLFVFRNGFKPGAPEVIDLFYAMFLHGGFAHLAGNMLFLWIYGDNVEHYLGRLPYLGAYLLTGVIATLSFGAFASGSTVPLVGASGAISGVLGLYFLLFPRNQVKVFVFLFPFLLNVFLVPARVVLGLYLVLDNLFPVLLGAQSNTAYGAHIGGFLGGLALAYWVEQRGTLLPSKSKTDKPQPAWDPKVLQREPSASDVQDAIAEGRWDEAVSITVRVGPRPLRDLPVPDTIRLATALDQAGYATLSTQLLRQALAYNQTNYRAMAEIYLALGLLRLANGQTTAAYQHLLSVLELAPNTSTAERAQAALARIDVYRRRN